MNVSLSIDDVIKQLRVPLQVGNLVVPFRETVRRLLAARPQQKRQLYGALRDALQQRGTSALYMTAVKGIVQGYKDNDKFDDERQALARLLAGRPPASTEPGVVTVLLGCTQPFLGQPFGVAQTLWVRARPWGGTIELEREGSSGEDKDTLYQGFRKGCEAGLEHLLSRGLGLLSGSILINNYTAQGTLPALHVPGSGHSLGLGAAMATLSGALGVRIPERTAFTGQVEIDGSIRPVGQIDVKVSAAVDVGITHVFLPNGHGVTGANAVTLHPCGVLRDAVDGVFTKEQIEAGIQKLRTVAGNITPHRRWRNVYTTSSGRMLLSVVGKSDPIGTLKNRHGKPITEQDGPILSAFRALRPRHVVLLYTALKGDNNLLHNATETRRFLEKEDESCKVQIVELDGVTDPTDVANLWNVFSRKVGEIVDSAQGNPVICTNVSSGSPQMQIVWHLLAERRILPGELLQVRESRFVEDGTTRVRPVVLPAVTTSGTAANPTPPFRPPIGS